MTEHAPFFQASSASRWIACPGSVKLCDGLEDTGSAYAEEGTKAHELAAQILGGSPVAGHWDGADEMTDHVMGYVRKVRTMAGDHPVMIEQRVDFSHVLDQPDCFGTADVIVLAGDEIQIHDLKYGMGVKVDATENPQLMLYALGALRDYDMVTDFKTARLCIHQVRLDHFSEWVVSIEDLNEFGKMARAAADEALSPEPFFQPTEKGCRFCKAKAHCPALLAHVEDTVGQSFDNLDEAEMEADPERMGTNYLAHCMAAVGLVEDWCKGIRARVERELLAGNQVDGWKLVQGRKGARKWSSEDEAEQTLRRMKLKVEDMYDLKLISPTTAEKLSKAGTIGPRQWPQLQALITQSEGGLSVAPASDKRPAANPVASADAFEAIA
jgi:hypothetical protein